MFLKKKKKIQSSNHTYLQMNMNKYILNSKKQP